MGYLSPILGLLLISLTAMATSNPLIQARKDSLDQLYSSYQKRFTSDGTFINNPKATQEFNRDQDLLAQRFLVEGDLIPLFEIHNDFNKDLVVKIFAFLDENQNLQGIYYEKSIYLSERERSNMRFLDLASLQIGIHLSPILGIPSLKILSKHMNAEKGGQVKIEYLTDLRNRRYSSIAFQLSRTNHWSVVGEGQRTVKRILAELNFSIAQLTGGITRLRVD